MGNQLCCDVKISTTQIQVAKNKQQLLREFMKANPQISAVCDRPGELFATVDKRVTHYQNGVYIGKIYEGKRKGIGLMMFNDNMYYEGQWQNDNFEGRGKFIFVTGDFYDGGWKNGLPSGQGLYVSRKPIWRYEGNWENGKQSGHGKEIFEDGSYYEGQFLKGLRHGRGKFKNHDGRYYDGNFIQGELEGQVTAINYTYIYRGQFKQGVIDGTGKSEWQPSKKNSEIKRVEYIGEYKRGKKHGFGQYRQKDGVIFKGVWKEGIPTNKGVLISSPNKEEETSILNDK